LELLLVVDLVFESSFHDVLSDFFDTIHEQTFQVILLSICVDPITLMLPQFILLSVNLLSQFFNCIRIVSFKSLYVFQNLFSNVIFGHFRLENKLKELSEFDVLGWDVPVPAHGASSHHSLGRHLTQLAPFLSKSS
jgi:hypothetical protein